MQVLRLESSRQPSGSSRKVSGGASVCFELLLWLRGAGNPWGLVVWAQMGWRSLDLSEGGQMESRGDAKESGQQKTPVKSESY